MLDNEAYSDMETIKTVANEVWGENVQFKELKILDSPYPGFEWSMRLYNNIDVLLAYDRSALDIGIPRNGQPVLMSEFTDKPFIRGRKSTQPDNLLNNFRVLDDVIKEIVLKK